MLTYSEGIYYTLDINKMGSMCAGKCAIDPGKELNPHSHSPDELYIITKGTGLSLIHISEPTRPY